MRKIILLCVILMFLISGCATLDISDFVCPDNLEFIMIVDSLDTPEKICDYMKEHFVYKGHAFYNLNPYELFLGREGDCNDFVAFASYIAEYHGYKTYQIQIFFKGTWIAHVLGVYVEDDKYTYSNGKAYYPIYVDTFGEVVSHYFSMCKEYELKKYKVYNYEMNLIEEVNSN